MKMNEMKEIASLFDRVQGYKRYFYSREEMMAFIRSIGSDHVIMHGRRFLDEDTPVYRVVFR